MTKKPYKKYMVTHIVTKSFWVEALDEEEAISLAQDLTSPSSFEDWYGVDLTTKQHDETIKPHNVLRRKN